MKNTNGFNTSCAAVQEELLESFDGGSFDRLTEPAAAHISACAVCRNEWQELNALAKDLQSLPEPIPGDPYWIRYLPRLREKLESGPKRVPVKRPIWAPSLTAAALFSLFVVFSPVKIAPPSWFQSDKMLTTSDQILQEEELSKLERLFTGAEISDSYYEQLELNLIYELSRSQYEAPQDLYDQLAEVDDQTLEKLLTQLSAQKII
jgi:hypothetical protein